MRKLFGSVLTVGLWLACLNIGFAQPPNPEMVVGQITPAPVREAAKQAAKQAVAQESPKKLALKQGEFFVMPHAGVEPLTWQVAPESDGTIDTAKQSIVSMVLVPVGKTVEIMGIRSGETEFKTHAIEAKDRPITIIYPYKPGFGVWTVWKAVESRAVQTDVVVISIDGIKPPDVKPPPDDTKPVNDPLYQRLKKAFDVDVITGKSDKKIVGQLAGVYYQVAQDKLTDYKTLGEVYEKLILPAVKKMNIPDPEVIQFNLRDQIANELLEVAGAKEQDYSKALTDQGRTDLQKAFLKVSEALVTISK